MMYPSRPDPIQITSLLERQATLQAEAAELLTKMDLVNMLSQCGSVELVGSFPLGLMVRRDLDIRVLCPDLELPKIVEVLTPLFASSNVGEMRYRRHSPTGLTVDLRLYFYVFVRDWKIDIAFWRKESCATGGPRDYTLYRTQLLSKLSEETIVAILWIKDVWSQSPNYPSVIGSKVIYEAVLDAGVRTPAQFEIHLKSRGLAAN